MAKVARDGDEGNHTAMEALAEWLTKETGYAVDARTVALAGSLRNVSASE